MNMSNTEKTVKDIRRKTRRKFSTEEKIRIILDGLRGESSVAELCRQESINPNLYYRWSKSVAPVSIAGMPLTRKVDWTALPAMVKPQGVTGTGYRTRFAA